MFMQHSNDYRAHHHAPARIELERQPTPEPTPNWTLRLLFNAYLFFADGGWLMARAISGNCALGFLCAASGTLSYRFTNRRPLQ
jgi:hypothetical protein